MRTLGFLEMKSARGAMVRGPSRVLWAALSPAGPVTVQFDGKPDDLVVEAWGDGAEWAMERASAIAGLDDDVSGFDPPPGLIRDLSR